MKRAVLVIVALLLVVSGASAHNPKEWRKMKSSINFLLVSDVGREGCFDQKVVANLMGEVAKSIKPRAIIATGDTHHGKGVSSVDDSHWQSNFEAVYTHPKLNIDWYVALGNHEYQGSPNALIEYSSINPRWHFPKRYYTTVFKKSGVTIRFVMLDTTPMIDRFRAVKNPEARQQDYNEQLEWLDSVLKEAKEDWVIVAGHHPIYAQTHKKEAEREDMQNRLNSVLCNHSNVDVYLAGHVHSFQHFRTEDSDIDYVVNTSGGMGRDVKQTKGTQYCGSASGFSVLSASKKSLTIYMIDKNGNILHSVNRKR